MNPDCTHGCTQGFVSCLVFAIILLGVTQYPVAELQHVFKGGIALIAQILQLQNGSVFAICKCRFENAKDLTTHTPSTHS